MSDIPNFARMHTFGPARQGQGQQPDLLVYDRGRKLGLKRPVKVRVPDSAGQGHQPIEPAQLRPSENMHLSQQEFPLESTESFPQQL